MKKITLKCAVFFCALFSLWLMNLPAQTGAKLSAENFSRKNESMKQILIDRFTVPATTKDEFLRRMKSNRDFIRKLPGFVKDEVYERTGEDGESNFITVAIWKNSEALENAKIAVSAEYKKQSFEMPAFLERLKIKIDRAIYQEFTEQ